MKKAIWNIISIIIVSIMVLSNIGNLAYAEELEEDYIGTTVEQKAEASEQDEQEENEQEENEQSVDVNEKKEQSVDVGENAQELLNYIYISEAEQKVGSEQNILVSWNTKEQNIQEMHLLLEEESGRKVDLLQKKVDENVFLFQKIFEQGIYHISGIEVITSDNQQLYSAEELNISAYFGVGETYTGNDKSTHMEMQSVDAGENINDVQTQSMEEINDNTFVMTIDENGNTTAQESLSNALDEVGAIKENTYSRTVKSRMKSDVVIVLDPGHDATHTGAFGNGVHEEIATLTIAKACKEELEKYSGVTVYLTRENSKCPYPEVGTGHGSNVTDIKKRVEWAKTKGANAFVSIHLNSSDKSAANGAEVYYPSTSSEGKNLAQDILNKLIALGLTNRGVRNNYDDYAVIKNSTLNGFPGLIVEHAFVSNGSDASKYLNSNEKLKQLGIADAEGIAQHFGLTKGKSFKIQNKNDFEGKAEMKISGMGSNAKLQVTSEKGDFKEYNLTNGMNTVEFTIKDFNDTRGTYSVSVIAPSGEEIYSDSFYVSRDTSVTITASSPEQKEMEYVINTKFNDMPQEVNGLSIAVWSEKGGQDDLVWYSATKKGQEWSTKVDITKHQTPGKYEVDVYANLLDGSVRGLGSTFFDVTQPSVRTEIENYQENQGTFDIVIKDIKCPAGVTRISVPVWSKQDQSDIYWYSAEKQVDGTYKVTVNIANHGYSVGTYIAHAYIYSKNGITVGQIVGIQQITTPKITISAEDVKKTQMQYLLKAQNVETIGRVQNILFATWSEKGGQDDLVWYGGTRNTLGEWTTIADITKHRTAGKYDVDVYAVMSDGSMRGLGSTSFTVTQPSMKASVENYQENQGTFDVVIKDIDCPSGVSGINVPVWSKSDQSDIHWYGAEKQVDGSYKVTVSIANHGYSVGTYIAHTYLYSENGMTIGQVAGTQQVTMPKMTISAKDINNKEQQYMLKVQNVGILGGVRSVLFATWSEKGGQDDLVWYGGTRNTLGEWTTIADITKHRTAGKYDVDVYAVMSDGSMRGLGSTSFTVTQPSMKASVENYQENQGTFDVVIKDIDCPSGVSGINVPVWSKSDQSDIHWYGAEKQVDGSYKVTVSIANHGYSVGTYIAHTYLYSENGMTIGQVAGTQQVTMPKMTISAKDINNKEQQYMLKVQNVGILGGVRSVLFATWSEKGGQDDLVWYGGTRNTLGEWTTIADITKHRTAGKYDVDVYAIMSDGSMRGLGNTSFDVKTPRLDNITVSMLDENLGQFSVNVTIGDVPSGIANVLIPVWCKSDQSDIRWYGAEKQNDGSYKIIVDSANHGYDTGLYKIHVYVTTGNGIFANIGSTSMNVLSANLYPIMGDSTVTVQQMVKWFKSKGNKYPSTIYSARGAEDIEQFCEIYYEEAAAEGVRVEVAFAQAMKETGWLQFGGIVDANQCNFAGIGALDGNDKGKCASFNNVREGVRAQIQHLKAYASTETLNNSQVDPRFHLVTRGSAPYVEWLGIQENPNHVGWATGRNYGYNIVTMIKELKSK